MTRKEEFDYVPGVIGTGEWDVQAFYESLIRQCRKDPLLSSSYIKVDAGKLIGLLEGYLNAHQGEVK